VEALDLASAINDCMVLAGHRLSCSGITVQRHCRATRQPHINRQELQQVPMNLIVNALLAMPDGGTMTLVTRDEGDDAVLVDVGASGSAAVWWNLMAATSSPPTVATASQEPSSRCC
jgi:two-component system NtrC family sensor kinase